MSIEAMNWAWKRDIPSPGKKFVLVSLANFSDGDGHCFPGQMRLAKMTGQTDRTVRTHLKSLEAEGFISRTTRFRSNGTRSSDSYQIHWKNQPPENSSAGKDCTDNRKKTAGPPEKISGHESSVNPQKEPSVVTPKKIKFDPLKVRLPEFLDPEVWASWVRHRAEINKPLTETTVAGQFSDLKRFFADVGRDPNERLKEAISGSWQGFCFAEDRKRAAATVAAPQAAKPHIPTTEEVMREALGDSYDDYVRQRR